MSTLAKKAACGQGPVFVKSRANSVVVGGGVIVGGGDNGAGVIVTADGNGGVVSGADGLDVGGAGVSVDCCSRRPPAASSAWGVNGRKPVVGAMACANTWRLEYVSHA